MTSSGNMPPVCSNSVRRSSLSVQPNRLATPGRYHTGSVAALVTAISRADLTILPSTVKPVRLDRVDDLGHVDVGLGDRDGRPDVVALRPDTSRNASATTAPYGSIETIFSGSCHAGYGPIESVGEVLVRSGTCCGSSALAAIASARYTA